MPKVNKFSSHRAEFERVLLIEHEQRAKILVKKFELEGSLLLNQTLQHKQSRALSGAKPKVVSKINKVRGKGVEITLRLFMSLNGSSDSHILWHILNSGRKDRHNIPKPIMFNKYKSRRTVPKSLKVGTTSGKSNDMVFIPKGGTLRGFKATEWYKEVNDELNKWLKSGGYLDVLTINRNEVDDSNYPDYK